MNGVTELRYFPTHSVTPTGCAIDYFLLKADGTSLDADLSSVISLESFGSGGEYRMTMSTNSNLKAGAHALRV